MAITAVEQWSTTAASNVDLNSIPIDGAVTTPSQVDNLFRELMAQVATQMGEMNFKGADIASAATTNLATATGWYVDITGTTTITALGTVDAGKLFMLRFTGILTFTHNATSLILPRSVNITTVAGDVAFMVSLGSGNWRCINYFRNSNGFGNLTITLDDSATQPLIINSGILSETDIATSQKGTIHLANTGTPADGRLGNGISFSGVNTGRRRVLIASYQDGADGDPTGLKIFVYPSTTSGSDAVTLALTISSAGAVTIPGTLTVGS